MIRMKIYKFVHSLCGDKVTVIAAEFVEFGGACYYLADSTDEGLKARIGCETIQKSEMERGMFEPISGKLYMYSVSEDVAPFLTYIREFCQKRIQTNEEQIKRMQTESLSLFRISDDVGALAVVRTLTGNRT